MPIKRIGIIVGGGPAPGTHGVISAVADDDGVVRRLTPLHLVYGEILPGLPVAALLAAEPEAVPAASGGELRIGARAWRVSSDGSILLRFPGNADALSVVPFFQLVGAAAGWGATACFDPPQAAKSAATTQPAK